MQSIIHFLIVVAFLLFLIALIWALQKWREHSNFKSNYKVGSLVNFFVGHDLRNGKIIKIHWNRAQIRDFFDQNTYTRPFYQIQNPDYHADTK